MAEPDYKKLYEKAQKTIDALTKKREAYYATEEAFFEWMEKRFESEYYRELWNELECIAYSHHVKGEITEQQMERKFKQIEIDYYFPEKSNEEETEENYHKYRG